jgi:type IX secretion system PorP/SprF family membrane protein
MRVMKLTMALFTVLMGSGVFAQQLPYFSQFALMPSFYNPAAAGLSGRNFAGATYRSMWESFPGNPRTTLVYGDAEIKKLNAGISAYLFKDQTGALSDNGLQISYSYHIHSKNNKNHLGLGLEVRGLQRAADMSRINEALGSSDPVNGIKSNFAFDAGAGVYWTNGKMSAGAAVTNLIGSKLNKISDPTVAKVSKLYKQYNTTFSYRIQTGDDIFIVPNALIRFYENAPTEFDLGGRFDYKDKMWWGMNMRVNQFWSLQAGLKIKNKVRLTYAYDFYLSPASVFEKNSGANEIGLQYDFGKK